jgi:hypothetical protein
MPDIYNKSQPTPQIKYPSLLKRFAADQLGNRAQERFPVSKLVRNFMRLLDSVYDKESFSQPSQKHSVVDFVASS